jgi:FtsP/CotA-like multicopper oxidase with cupredoxin domain
MAKTSTNSVARRGFLKGAAAGAAALVSAPPVLRAQQATPRNGGARPTPALPPIRARRRKATSAESSSKIPAPITWLTCSNR